MVSSIEKPPSPMETQSTPASTRASNSSLGRALVELASAQGVQRVVGGDDFEMLVAASGFLGQLLYGGPGVPDLVRGYIAGNPSVAVGHDALEDVPGRDRPIEWEDGASGLA